MYIKAPKMFCYVSLKEIWLKILSKNNEKGSKANCTNSQGKNILPGPFSPFRINLPLFQCFPVFFQEIIAEYRTALK